MKTKEIKEFRKEWSSPSRFEPKKKHEVAPIIKAIFNLGKKKK
jgi:hypothetical protein